MRVTRSEVADRSVEAVFRTFVVADCIAAKYESMGARNIEVKRCEGSGGSYQVESRREVPAEVPTALKRFVRAWNHVTQIEDWGQKGDRWHGDLKIVIGGVPVDIRSEVVIRPEGEGGSATDARVDVTCSIPIVGRKLARFVADYVDGVLAQESAFIREYLSTRPDW